MMIIFIFALLLGLAFGQNSHGLTLDEVIDLVVRDLDINPKDGIISLAELEQELVARWEHDGDGCVSRHEFEKQWVATYHDHPGTVNEFFHRLDVNGNGCLDNSDIEDLTPTADTNGDLIVTIEEFRIFMHHVHPEGPHGG